MKKNIAKTFYKRGLVFISFLIILLSCTKTGRKQAGLLNKQERIVPPHVTVLANLPYGSGPRETFLSESPRPLQILIPIKAGNHYIVENAGGSETIKLFLPVKHLFIDPLTRMPIAPEAQGKGFFTTYDTEDGLALDAILCSIEDKNGNLWFGTAGGGVSRYNGKYFLNYTTVQGLAFNTVNVIFEDKSGNLWFGTSGGGVSKFDGNSFVNYTAAQGLANNSVSSVLEDEKGNFWFGTADGLSKFDGKSFTNISTKEGLVNNTIWSITEDKTGNLWIGTTGGVSKYNGKSFVNYSIAQGLAANAVLCMVQDKNGNFWFGTRDGGVSKFDGKSFVNFSTVDGLAGNKVVNIMEDRSGNLWFETYGHGVSKYDGKTFVNFNTSQGLAGNVVAAITEDKTGNIWFGTYGAGISKYNGKSFVNFTTANGLANNVVRSIAQDKSGNLWFGTNGGGISKYDGHSFVNYTTAQGLPNNLCYSIIEDGEGYLWFGTLGGGLSKYDGKSFTNYTKKQGLASNDIMSIARDNKGNIWIGTNGSGLSKFDGKSFVNFTATQGLADNTVLCTAFDKSGNLWIGTNAGISKYDGKSFVNFTTKQGLSNNIVNSLTFDNSGNLWIGTEVGLSLLRNNILNESGTNAEGSKTSVGQLFENFITDNGLPDNYVTQVIQENQNKMLVGTNLGICELIAENESNYQKEWKVGKIFNTVNGYPVKDVNAGQNTMFKDNKGIIWIATGSDKTGLVRFNPAEIHLNHRPPILEIHNIKINNEPVSWHSLLHWQKGNAKLPGADSLTVQSCTNEEIASFGKVLSEASKYSMIQKFKDIHFDGINKWYPIPQNLVLPYKNNDISFDFTVIDPGEGLLIKYQYMLEGSDKEWSSISNKSSAGYGNLFEGRYTFRLRAQNIDGIWSKQLNYTFTVSPPWWRTWWAYFIYFLLLTMIVFIVHRRQKQQVIRIERGKAQIRELAQAKEIEKAYTELKATQAQLIQSEKMASLGELTAGIAHEILNPLNFVNNFSEVSKELLDEMKTELDKGNTDDAKEIATDVIQNLEKINQHGKRADAIVQGMLQHSNSGSGSIEPTNVNTLANEYLRIAYHGYQAKNKSFKATLKTDFDESIGNIDIIPQDIGRVILNLIMNAFYAVDEKCKLMGAEYEPIVSLSTRKTNDKVELLVTDNGNGISQKVVEKIFQPFFTTKPAGQGTGLGLSLAYDIVRAHGGELHVETKEGEGSAFKIRL